MNGQSRELSGRAAIVTGSARNIGRAIALALAAGGADVAINARTSRDAAEATAREAEALGVRAIVHMGDVTRPQDAQALADAAQGAFGRIDYLVNNVSERGEVPFDELTFERWHEVLASTLDSAFLCTKAALPRLRESGAGAIVNIGGVASHAGFPERAHVAAAKAGLCGMTGSLATELAPDSITVNTVIPALINTKRDGGAIPPLYATRPVPMGRTGEPDEVASVVRYLCGPGARFVSGQSIHVNGAWYVTV
ncbi:MAG: SDR family oxidoreductase [Rhodospirillaceae bacterium]